MHNYYTNLVWKIDAVLLAASLALTVVIIFNAAIREYLWKRRSRALLNIKEHVYELVLSGEEINKEECAKIISVSTPQQFLDVATNRNRELIFFNDSEQELFKKHFLSAQNISRLKKIAKNPGNKWHRIEAIMSLGYANVTNAADIFKKTIFSKDEDIAYFSMMALGQFKNAESARALIELCKKNPLWRHKLFSILESFPPDVIDEIMKLMKDKDASVRLWAMKLASKFNVKGHFVEIKKLVDDKSPEVRAALYECLGKSGTKAYEDILVAALEDDSWLVRASAARGLSSLLNGKCMPLIMKLANDGSLYVIDAIKDIMISYPEEAMPYMEKFLEGGNPMAQKISLEALERSGYIIKILTALASKEEGGSEKSERLIRAIIKKGGHNIGIEASIEMLDAPLRSRAISEIKKIDAGLAEHLDKKIKGEISE